MSPTRDRLVLIVPSFFGAVVLVMGGTYGGELCCVCVRACTRVCAHTSFFPPVLLFPLVISEGKVIRCLIGGSVNQSAPYGVHMRASVYHLQAAPRGLHMQREKHRILDGETRCHDEDPNRAICGRLNIK